MKKADPTSEDEKFLDNDSLDEEDTSFYHRVNNKSTGSVQASKDEDDMVVKLKRVFFFALNKADKTRILMDFNLFGDDDVDQKKYAQEFLSYDMNVKRHSTLMKNACFDPVI